MCIYHFIDDDDAYMKVVGYFGEVVQINNKTAKARKTH